MMYDEYVKKIEKLSRIKNGIYKFRFLIIGVLVAIIATVTTLLSIKGNTSELLLPENITYGEAYTASCDAVMSDIIGYEYKEVNGTEWKSGLPTKPGEYLVRALSERSFGGIGHSEEKKIIIAKRDLELSIESKTITYGEFPKISSKNLTSTDKITEYVFSFDDITKSNTLVDLKLDSLTIKNNDNEIVTDCYNLKYDKQEIEFSKKDLTITPDGYTKEYDGSAITLPKTYKLSTELGYEDEIEVSEYVISNSSGDILESAINPGKYNLKIKSYNITSKTGSTLGNYNVRTTTASLVINKRSVKFNTSSNSKTYDGLELVDDTFEIQNGYSLVSGDVASAYSNTSITHYGSKNNELEIKITREGVDVSDFYSISYDYGTLTINKKDLTITTASLEKEYDGQYYSDNTYNQVGLVDNSDLISANQAPQYKNSGEYQNEFSVNLINPDDYNVIYNYGLIKINKRPISIRPIGLNITYGDNITFDYEVTSGSFVSGDTKNNIEAIPGYYQNNTKATPKNVGSYEIRIDNYNSLNYDVTHDETNTLVIDQFDVNLLLIPMSNVTYDGKSHKYNDNYGNYNSLNVLPYNERLKVTVLYNGTNNIPKNVGNYVVTYNDYEIDGGLKTNYNVNVISDSFTFDIIGRVITIAPITLDNTIYDGNVISYPADMPFVIKSGSMAEGEEIKLKAVEYINNYSETTPKNVGNYIISIADYEAKSSNTSLSNYQVSLDTSSFSITPKDIDITPINFSDKTYDGIEYQYSNSYNNFQESADIISGESLRIAVEILRDNNLTTEIKNAGLYVLSVDTTIEYVNTYARNYNITTHTVSFEIYKRPITIAPITLEDSTYDGDTRVYPVELPFSITSGSMVTGEEFVITGVSYINQYDETSPKNVGEYVIRIVNYSPNNANTLINNYIVTKNISTFKITPKDINITPINFDDKIYDGQAYIYQYADNNFQEAADVVLGETIRINVDITINGNPTNVIKNAGAYVLSVNSNIYYDNTLARNYNVTTHTSSFTISKRDVEFIISPGSKEYNGEAKTTYYYEVDIKNPDSNPNIGSLVDNESSHLIPVFSFVERQTLETTILYVGIYDISMTGYVENNYTINYNIDYSNTTTFEVTKRPISIKPKDTAFKYGEVITYDENTYIITAGSLTPIDDHTAISVTVNYQNAGVVVTPKNAGTYETHIISYVSRNYDVTHNETATLTIDPLDVEITLKPVESIVYDGLEHDPYVLEYDNYISSTTLPYNEHMMVTVLYDGSSTLPKNAGTYVISFNDYEISGGLKTNYNVTATGTINFTILPRDITLSLEQIEDKVYDGIAYQYLGTVPVLVSGSYVLNEGFTIGSVEYLVSGVVQLEAKDSYTYQARIKEVIPNAYTLVSNYNISYQDVTFKITPRNITFLLSTNVNTKVYDGDPYIGYTYYHTPNDALVGTELIEVTIKYKGDTYNENVIRNVDIYEVSLDNVVYSNGAKAINYVVDYTDKDEFEVTPKELNLTFDYTGALTKMYDGTQIDSTVYHVVVSGLVDTYDNISYNIKFNQNLSCPKDAGSYDITINDITITSKTALYDSRVENYEINTDEITYEITKRKLEYVLSSSIYSKDYDSIEYTGFSMSLTPESDGYVSGEGFDLEIVYSGRVYYDTYLRNADTYDVSIKYNGVLGNTKRTNYDLDYSDKKVFTINKVNLVFTFDYDQTQGLSKIYDGLPIPNIVSNIQYTGLCVNDSITYDVTYNGSTTNPKDVGVYTINIGNLSISALDSLSTRLENYNITNPSEFDYEIRKLPIKITIKSESESINYDSYVHTDIISYDLTSDYPLVSGEDIVPTIATTLREYGDTYIRNAGIYDITVTSLSPNANTKMSNYDITIEGIETFTVNPVTLTITYVYNGVLSKEYDGETFPQQDYVLLTNKKINDNIGYDFVYYENNELLDYKPKNVGNYTKKVGNLTVESTDSNYLSRIENYVVNNDDKYDVEITPRHIAISPIALSSKKYDGIEIKYNYSNSDMVFTLGSMVSGEAIEFTRVDIKSGENVVHAIDADNYTVVAPGVKAANENTLVSNYQVDISMVGFSIEKRDITFTLVSKKDNEDYYAKHYDGEEYHGFTYETTGDGFANGESIEPVISILGRITGDTIIKNIDVYDVTMPSLTYNNAKAKNYNVDHSDTKEFEVMKDQIEILLYDDGKTYDGVAYVHNGYEEFKTNPIDRKQLLLNNHIHVVVDYFDENKDPISTIKDAGTYYLRINETETINGLSDELRYNYNLTFDDEYVTYVINKLEVTIKPKSYESEDIELYKTKTYDRVHYTGYDGTKYDTDVDIPEGEGFIIEVMLNNSSVIDCVNANDYTLGIASISRIGATNLDNYIIHQESYSFSIDPIDIYLSPLGKLNGENYYLDKTYDGIAYDDYDITKDELLITYKNVSERLDNVKFKATANIPCNNIVDAKEYTLSINSNQPILIENDIMSNFNILDYNSYDFEISKRPVEIALSIPNNTKVYDGLEYVFDGTYSITSGNFVKAGERLVVAVKDPNHSVIKQAANYHLSIDTSRSQLLVDKISNYSITSNTVDYSITPREITIKNLGNVFEYDGTYRSYTYYEITSGSLITGERLQINTTVTKRNAGIYENANRYNVYNNNTPITDSYSITYIDENLEITPKALRLVSKSQSFVYDKQSHSAAEFTTVEGLCATDNIDYDTKKSTSVKLYTGVGVNNEVAFKILNGKDVVTNSYEIDMEYGILTITKRDVVITGYKDYERDYTGKVISNPSKMYIQYESYNIPDSVDIVVENLPTNAGIYECNISVTITNNVDCYNLIDNSNGKINITVTKKDVTVTTQSKSWIYDGVVHDYLYYDSVSGLISGHTIEVLSGVSIVNEGEIDNHLTYQIKDVSGSDVTSNYNITEDCGKLTVVGSVNLKINDKEYIGGSQTILIEDLTVLDSNNNPTDLYTINSFTVLTDISSFIDVGSYNVTISYEVIETSGDKTLSGSTVAELNIVPREVSININNVDRTFDGSLQEIGLYDYTIVSGSLLSGDILGISSTDSGYAGNIKVETMSYVVTRGYNDVTANYNVTLNKSGKISISKITISVSVHGATFNFDNQEHYCTDYDVTSYDHFNTFNMYSLQLNLVNYTKIKEIGKSKNTIRLEVIDNLNRSSVTIGGKEFRYADAYKFSYDKGYLEVVPGELAVSVIGDVVEFDGESHTPDYVITLNGDVYTGSDIDIEVSVDSYYYVGSYLAAPTLKSVKIDGVDAIDNFATNMMPGQFIIDPYNSIINIETESKSVPYYDGIILECDLIYVNNNPMTKSGTIFTYEMIINGHVFTISLINDTSISSPGTIKNEYHNLSIFDENNNNVTECFTIVGNNGYLTIVSA